MLLGLEISRNDAAVILASLEGEAKLALRQEFQPNLSASGQWLAAMELCRSILGRAVVEPNQITRVAVVLDAHMNHHGVVQRDAYRPGWDGYDLPRGIKEHLGILQTVCAPRVIAEALAETHYGVLKDSQDWLFVHLGRTLEACGMTGGVMIQGPQNAAMDIGGINIERDGAVDAYGRRGSLAAYIGGDAFETRCRSYGITFHKAHEVWDLMESNFAAQSLVEDFTNRLGQGLTAAVSLFNPSIIAFGGGFAEAVFPRFQAPLALKLRELNFARSTEHLELRAGKLGADAAVLGAIVLARTPNLRGAP